MIYYSDKARESAQNKIKESQIPKERLSNAKKYKEELKKSEK